MGKFHDIFRLNNKDEIDKTVMDKIKLDNLVDTHIHAAPDIKPRALDDIGAASHAKSHGLKAIVLKSHVEPTVSRAQISQKLTKIDVFGGVCLNSSVGGINPEIVKITAQMGGKIVWLPTISFPDLKLDIQEDNENLEEIFHIIAQNDLVLGTGHLSVPDIFMVMDMARNMGIKKIIVNHPLTRVVGAGLEEQKEMAKYAFLEHCFVACMPKHDQLLPEKIAEAINYVGYEKCIMATDFGQKHNPFPVDGFKMFIYLMKEYGISKKHINIMCSQNPSHLFY